MTDHAGVDRILDAPLWGQQLQQQMIQLKTTQEEMHAELHGNLTQGYGEVNHMHGKLTQVHDKVTQPHVW